MEGQQRVDGSSDRHHNRRALFGNVSGVRSQRDNRYDRARALWRRQCCRSPSGELQVRGFRRAQVRGHARRDGPPADAGPRRARGQGGKGLPTRRDCGSWDAFDPRIPDRRHFVPAIADLLHQRFDPEKLLVTSFEPENCQIYIDEDRLSKLGLTLNDLAKFLETQPYLFAVFAQDEVARNCRQAGSLATAVAGKSRGLVTKLGVPNGIRILGPWRNRKTLLSRTNGVRAT